MQGRMPVTRILAKPKLIAALALALVALAATPAAASAAWGTPIDVSTGNESVFGAVASAGDDGRVHVAWDDYYNATSSNTIHYARIAPDGTTVSPPVVLNPSQNGLNPQIAAKHDGGATVVWNWNSGGVVYSRIDPAGSFSSPATISAAGGAVPLAIAVDANDVTTIAWRSGSTVGFVRVAADGTAGSAQTIAAGGSVRDVALAAAPDGHLVVAWVYASGGSVVAQYAPVSATGTVGSVTTATTATGSVSYSQTSDVEVATNAAGTILIGFTATTSGFPGSSYAYYVLLPSGTSTATARAFANPASLQSRKLSTALYADGRGLVTGLTATSSSGNANLMATPIAADGTPGTSFNVSGTLISSGAGGTQLAIDAAGTATFSWRDFTSNAIYASQMPDGASAGAPVTIASATAPQSISTTIDPTGTATATWLPNGGLVQAARFTTPPVCTNATTSVSEGSATLQALSCTGRGTLSYALASPAAHGTVAVDATTGVATYVAATGFAGTDSFTFTATNSAGVSQANTVTVVVTATASGPAPTTTPPTTSIAAPEIVKAALSKYVIERKASDRAALKVHISLTLPAGVTLRITRRYGRMSGGRCKATTARTIERKRCRLDARAFTTSLATMTAGEHTITIPAATVRKLLRPGTYQLILQPAGGDAVTRAFSTSWIGQRH